MALEVPENANLAHLGVNHWYNTRPWEYPTYVAGIDGPCEGCGGVGEVGKFDLKKLGKSGAKLLAKAKPLASKVAAFLPEQYSGLLSKSGKDTPAPAAVYTAPEPPPSGESAPEGMSLTTKIMIGVAVAVPVIGVAAYLLMKKRK